MVDRLYADKDTMHIYDNSKIMGFETVNKIGRKQQFLVALGLGFKLGTPTPLQPGKSLMFLEKDMTDEELALLWAVAINEKGSISDVGGKDEVYKIAEEYANTGVRYLERIEQGSSFDNYLQKFEKIISDEIKSHKKSEKSED